ncbi:outer membrane protein [Methylobacterium nonmethylotrophicum]|uniref:Porin family protein n=1 Tax=Methylobacterium nonmethylotrophicum TaxID=1141884 RepID=A0A4Z0NUG4_9HYPH|nr:porin family protein [Methylobacterium nonmethylotrophicum]TGE00556.1 porin family protein [Methylobacterium nonmethylotrophicum]
MIKKLMLAGAATSLLAGAASAADLPRRAAPPPVFTPVPVFTWTGFYAGLHTDYTFTDRQPINTFGNTPLTITNVATLRRPPTVRNEQDGLANIGGGFGYNYQFTPGSGFVVGVQADWAWNDIHKNTFYLGPPLAANGFVPDPAAFRQELSWLGTVVGRVGYAFDRFFVFGMGGFAYGGVDYRANFYTPGGVLAYAGRYNDIETGYAYGGGIEYALPTDSFLSRFSLLGLLGVKSEAVTIKAEYLHYDLGTRNVLVNNTGIVAAATGSYTSRFRTEGNLVRAGFSYKFNGL